MDYISLLPETAQAESIRTIRQKRLDWAGQDKKGFLRYRKPAERLASFTARHVDCEGDIVTIGAVGERTEKEREAIKNDLRAFMPWRKGPFSVFGIDVDAEWRSEIANQAGMMGGCDAYNDTMGY